MQELREMWSVGAVWGRTGRGGEPISRSGTVKWGCQELTFSGNASRLISRLKTFPNLPIPHSITLHHTPSSSLQLQFQLQALYWKNFPTPPIPRKRKIAAPKNRPQNQFHKLPNAGGRGSIKTLPPHEQRPPKFISPASVA